MKALNQFLALTTCVLFFSAQTWAQAGGGTGGGSASGGATGTGATTGTTTGAAGLNSSTSSTTTNLNSNSGLGTSSNNLNGQIRGRTSGTNSAQSSYTGVGSDTGPGGATNFGTRFNQNQGSSTVRSDSGVTGRSRLPQDSIEGSVSESPRRERSSSSFATSRDLPGTLGDTARDSLHSDAGAIAGSGSSAQNSTGSFAKSEAGSRNASVSAH